VAPGEAVSDEDFKVQLETLNEELETLNAQARELEQTIARMWRRFWRGEDGMHS
jgi:type I restriction enzyme M protein